MEKTNSIKIEVDREEVDLDINTVLYVNMRGNNAEIHVAGGDIYTVRMTLCELEEKLGEDFIKPHRSILVSVKAIHEVSKQITLSNGEVLDYVVRKKKEVLRQLHEKQQRMVHDFAEAGVPTTYEEYCNYYEGLQRMPFAFADIEMVFDENLQAVDWIFRYGNDALAKLEKIPLEQLMGRSFSELFPNMDSRWLRSYERATLYGETLEIIDYSPEIDTYLKVICFPTFHGHCGCILFDIETIQFTRNSSDAERALMLYFGKLPDKHD